MTSKKLKKMKKGFSLIELIVVIAIIMIMTALLLSVGSRDRTKRDLITASRQVAAGLRQAQTDALTGRSIETKNPCDFTFTLTGNTYDITFSYYDAAPGSTDFTPDADANDLIDCADSVPGSITSGVTLPKGVSALNPPAITFSVPHGIPSDAVGTLKTPQPFVLKEDNMLYAVCLSPSGRVDEIGLVESESAAKDTCANL